MRSIYIPKTWGINVVDNICTPGENYIIFKIHIPDMQNEISQFEIVTCKAQFTGFADRIYLTPSQNDALGTVFTLLTPFTILFNIILIVYLIKSKQLRRASNSLTMLLSISDFCMGTICMPLTIILFLRYPYQRKCTLEITVQTVKAFFGHLSAYTTVTIAIDRYVNINPNLKHFNNPLHKLFSPSKIWIPIIITFVCTSVITAIITYTAYTKYHNIAVMVIMNLDLLVLLLMFVLYLRFFYKIWKFTKKSEVYSPSVHTKDSKAKAVYLGRLGMTIFLILTAIVICYLPFVTVVTYELYISETDPGILTDNDTLRYIVVSILVYFNSTLNSLIFLLRDKKVTTYLSSCLGFDQKCNLNSFQVNSTDNTHQHKEEENTLELEIMPSLAPSTESVRR